MSQKYITQIVRALRTKNFVLANEAFAAAMQQKVTDRLVEERKTLHEADAKPETRKCKDCGKTFTPQWGEYARCKDCFDKQTDAGERATAGRY